MQPYAIEQLLRTIDARATRIAQFLPAMTTKQELREAIDNAASKLATKEDVRLLAEQVLAIRQRLDDGRT